LWRPRCQNKAGRLRPVKRERASERAFAGATSEEQCEEGKSLRAREVWLSSKVAHLGRAATVLSDVSSSSSSGKSGLTEEMPSQMTLSEARSSSVWPNSVFARLKARVSWAAKESRRPGM